MEDSISVCKSAATACGHTKATHVRPHVSGAHVHGTRARRQCRSNVSGREQIKERTQPWSATPSPACLTAGHRHAVKKDGKTCSQTNLYKNTLGRKAGVPSVRGTSGL